MSLVDTIVQLIDLHPAVLFLLFALFLVIAYKLVKTVLAIVLVAAVGAAFPLVLTVVGIDTSLSLQSSLWFALFAVLLYIIYALLKGVGFIAKILTAPFRWLFGGREK